MASTPLASGYLDLGYDDCETCGGNSNTVEWDYDGSWIRVHASVGCYGSYNQSMDSAAHVAEFLADFRNRFPDRVAELEGLAEELVTVLRQSPPPFPSDGAPVEGVDYNVLDYDDRS